jgi:hypothetical protein
MADPITINPIGTGAFIVRESNGYRSREEVTIAATAGILQPGTVLGKITASGKYVGFAPGASDGTQTAAAILFEEVDATSADVKRTVILRDCEVQRAALAFIGTPTEPQKTAAYASLAALGIAFR